MGEWRHVQWSEAGQVAGRVPSLGDLGESGRSPPQQVFERLRRERRPFDAAFFLGAALPRFEAVAWAARFVRDCPRAGAPPGQAAQDALNRTLVWMRDPSDRRRRSVFMAAETIRAPSAERLLGLAVYFSGGSIAPEGHAAVPPPPHAAGRFAAAAVVAAALASSRGAAAIDTALDDGEAIAERGLGGGPP